MFAERLRRFVSINRYGCLRLADRNRRCLVDAHYKRQKEPKHRVLVDFGAFGCSWGRKAFSFQVAVVR
jgi:hypothetical protein